MPITPAELAILELFEDDWKPDQGPVAVLSCETTFVVSPDVLLNVGFSGYAGTAFKYNLTIADKPFEVVIHRYFAATDFTFGCISPVSPPDDEDAEDEDEDEVEASNE